LWQTPKLNNFSPSARQAILEFEDWQRRVFAKTQKKDGDSSNLTLLINLHLVQQKKHGVRHMKAKIE
jgi:hypothetical protein